jgi:TonB family protein
MWPLQHKNLHKKTALWLKIIGLSIVFHAIILVWVLCIYQENKYMNTLCVNKKVDYSLPIIFSNLPACITVEKATIATKNKPVNIVPAPKKPAAPTVSEKTTIIKTPIKHIEEKKELAPIKSLVKETPPQTLPATSAQVSNNYREVEAMRRTAQLQKELVQQWHPPIGSPTDCSCDVSFFVNKQGTIQKVTIAKSSGIFMFDISVRQALDIMKMPPWTYGKSLTISFK